MNNQLPDTPWHIGYAIKKDNDPRRHKARCVHYQKGICVCPKLRCYLTECIGSSHCPQYSDSTIDHFTRTGSIFSPEETKAILEKKKIEANKNRKKEARAQQKIAKTINKMEEERHQRKKKD